MDVLCTDKTGTLTQDRIILKRHLDIRVKDCDRVLEYAYLNSRYQSGLKNLLDVCCSMRNLARICTASITTTNSTRYHSTSSAAA